MIINDAEHIGRRVSTSSQTYHSEEKIFYPRPYKNHVAGLEKIDSSLTPPLKLPMVRINKEKHYKNLNLTNWKNKKKNLKSKDLNKCTISPKPKTLSPDFFSIPKSPFFYNSIQEKLKATSVKRKFSPTNLAAFKKTPLSTLNYINLAAAPKKPWILDQESLFQCDTKAQIPKKKEYVMHKTFYDIYEELKSRPK